MRPRFLVSVICATALFFAATASQASAWVLHVRFPDRNPKSGEGWPIKVSAKRSSDGSPIHAAALYKFLFRGEVVATSYPSPNSPPCQGRERHKPYHFFGSYRDRLCFPSRAVGIPLTLRVVVKAGPLGTKHRDHDVVVRP